MEYKKFKNSVHPTKEQMDGFLEGNDDKPISMINLLKFKEKAEYEDSRETSLTGAEAYAIYGKEVIEHLNNVGGKWIFGAEITRLMLGDIEELWDAVAIAEYPSKKAMLKMITNPEYMKSHEHRDAGL